MLSVRHERLILRELLRLETAHETAELDNGSKIELMGPPFVRSDGEGVHVDERLPVLEFMFSRLIVTFPLFVKAKADFWPQTVQSFVQQLATADISSSADRDEATKRRRMARGVRRMLMMMLMAGLNTNNPKEETGRYRPGRTGALQSEVAPPSKIHDSEEDPKETEHLTMAQIRSSVIGCTLNPGTMFSGSQHLFIVESVLPGNQVVWVQRTYSDFQNFDRALVKHFPGKKFVHLPRKDTSVSNVRLKDGETVALPREHLREMLRNYLFQLSAFPQVVQCQPFMDFIAKSPISLKPDMVKDIEARIEFDQQRWADYTKFAELANQRAHMLEKYLVELKSEIILEDALPKIFFEMRKHQRIEDMSPIVQKLVEYCVVEFASIIHSALIAKDDSPELFSQLKRLHGLMPYKIMQGILMLSNPALIMKKMTDLFMATPFGSRSLLQKIFMNILADDSRSQGVLIDELKSVIKDDTLFEVLHKFAWSDHSERELVTKMAEQTNNDLVMTIFENSSLPQTKIKKIASWHRAWQAAVSDETSEETEKVESFSQLKDLYKLVVRQRDKDIMQEFWGEPQTIRIIKQVVDMIYGILIEIFRTANVAESVGDFERFVSDLIRLIDRTNGGMRVDANQMVEELIGVLQKHQNSVFKFINRVYSKEGGFFVEMILWLTRIVNFIRQGKEGGNIVDIVGLFNNAKEQGVIDADRLVSDLDKLDEWLVLRKETADSSRSTKELRQLSEPGKTFDVSDVGLTWDDVDYGYAEVERDEQEEILTPDQLGQDAVMQEKLRRQKLAEAKKRQDALPPRPQSKELEKLLPSFNALLTKLFQQIDTSPSKIHQGFM